MNYSIADLGKRVLVLGIVAGAVGLTGTARAADNTHDGFYLQAATGLGYYSVSAEAVPGQEESFSGVTVPLSLMLGGSPIEGLAIGGGFMIDYAPSPGYSVNGEDFDIPIDFTQYVIGIGPFADFYLDPKGGLHFQAFAGWGGIETSAEGNVGGSDPTGLVMALGAGYDVFVSSEWSIGGMGRLTFAPLSLNDVSFTTIEPALLLTATYH